MAWQLHGAKSQFFRIVQKAQQEGPQVVTSRGERVAVVLSARNYDTLRANRPTLVDDLIAGSPWDDELAEAVSKRAKLPDRDTTF